MSQLIYGRNKQVQFKDEKEKQEAINYILNTPQNVDFKIHEDNQNQGALGPEERIHFKNENGIPECLKRQLTAGNESVFGRINCKEFCEELRKIAKQKGI